MHIDARQLDNNTLIEGDICIIGAGAAGLFCAIQAGKRGRRVLILEHNAQVGRKILISGGDCLTGHDVNTGAELWRWGSWNPTRIGHWRLVPSPVGTESGAVVCAPKGVRLCRPSETVRELL